MKKEIKTKLINRTDIPAKYIEVRVYEDMYFQTDEIIEVFNKYPSASFMVIYKGDDKLSTVEIGRRIFLEGNKQ